MATIYEVAAAAGVAPSTVSRALRHSTRISEQTIGRIEQVAAELNYVPKYAAQALAGSSVQTLAMVLPRIAGSYYGDLAVGFETHASELDFSVIMLQADSARDRSRTVRRLIGQADAVAFLAKSAADDRLVQQVAASRPVVTVARTALPGIPALYSESTESAHKLTKHLIQRGRRRIAFVGPLDEGSDIAARHEGFTRALRGAGLRIPKPLTVSMDEQSGRQLARRLHAEGLPFDALVCGSDEIAIAILDELQRLGAAVPDDVAIVGWDDVQTARYLRPGLTTVKQPVTQLGALAVETLHRLLQGQDVEQRITLGTTIMHRQSCGCTSANAEHN